MNVRDAYADLRQRAVRRVTLVVCEGGEDAGLAMLDACDDLRALAALVVDDKLPRGGWRLEPA
jgi:hypothetical protein